KRHDRVQMSPRIMIVRARRVQHSPMLGQLALSHTVWSSRSRTIFWTSKKAGLVGSGTLIQSGWRRRGAASAVTTGRLTRVGDGDSDTAAGLYQSRAADCRESRRTGEGGPAGRQAGHRVALTKAPTSNPRRRGTPAIASERARRVARAILRRNSM